jgi:uncharacterized membrane protein
MSTLVVVGYEGPCKADAALLKLRRLQREYLLDLEDAPIAIKDRQRKAQLNHLVNLTAGGCDPWRLPGLAHWPDLPAITGALTDVGINDDFLQELAATMNADSTTQFVLEDLIPSLTSTQQFRSANVRCRMFVGGAYEGQMAAKL